MSKLADLIKGTTRVEGRPLGFATASSKAKASISIVALVHDRWPQGVSEAAGAGADVLLLTGRPSDKDLADAIGTADGRPCGLLATEVDVDRLEKLGESDLDFVALDTQAPASVLSNEKLGYVLHVREDLSEIQLRTLEALQLDALYVDGSPTPLTIARLLELRRASGLARKPLLLPVRPDTQQDDLLTLRESGVALVAVDTKERGAADTIARLRGVIDGLPQRRPRRDDANEALLPRAATADSDDDEDDE